MATTSGTAVVTSDRDADPDLEFDAPKHLVWKAYTTPELIRRWWSGGGVTSVEVDLRVGGSWRYVMMRTRGSTSPSTANSARSSRTSASSRPRSTTPGRDRNTDEAMAPVIDHAHRGRWSHDLHAAHGLPERGGA